MSGFLIAPAARGDLDAIWDYYAVELGNLLESERLGLIKPSDRLSPGEFRFSSEVFADSVKHAVRLRTWATDDT